LKLIQEARQSGLAVETLLVRSDVETAELNGEAPIYVLDQAAFRKIQNTETSQGVIALVRVKPATLTNLISNTASKGPIVCFVEIAGSRQHRDDHSSRGVVWCGRLRWPCGNGGLYNSKAVRASAGSIFRSSVHVGM
jgi:tRNA G18 (ribose-2'-O)-methylase SpoU